MQASVGAALANIAALSLATNYPTLASIPHSVINGYKNVLAIAVETDYSFPLAEKVRQQCTLLYSAYEGKDFVTVCECWPSRWRHTTAAAGREGAAAAHTVLNSVQCLWMQGSCIGCICVLV
jgi:hypothetical protein